VLLLIVACPVGIWRKSSYRVSVEYWAWQRVVRSIPDLNGREAKIALLRQRDGWMEEGPVEGFHKKESERMRKWGSGAGKVPGPGKKGLWR
jgi:hypothetical protein